MTNSVIILMIFLVVSAAIDLKERKISLTVCFLFFVVGVIFNIFWIYDSKISVFQIIISVIPGIIFILLSLLSRQKIGLGDGITVIVMGMYLGIERLILSLMASLIISSIFSILLIVIKKVKANYEIPFVPFLAVGTVLSLIGGS